MQAVKWVLPKSSNEERQVLHPRWKISRAKAQA
jgi:hypothetical protein